MQLVLKSIGYKSLPLDGVPFDSKQGVVPHAAGRVLAGGWWDQTTLAVWWVACTPAISLPRGWLTACNQQALGP